MPVPVPTPSDLPLFPPLTTAQVAAALTSAWYHRFRRVTIPTVILDLEALAEHEVFTEWLDADSIFLPEGSAGSSLSPDNRLGPSRRRSSTSSCTSSSSSSSSASAPVYRLPKLNAAIRDAIAKYGGAVFPKLNWTSPKDAAFIIPQTAHGPLYCTSPADVYLLLKSSDFIEHNLDPCLAYEGCLDTSIPAKEDDENAAGSKRRVMVELVLKRFVEMNPSREARCFVRNDILVGVCQRDTNYYDHLQDPITQRKICDTVRSFWEDEIRGGYRGGADYVFDIYLSSSLESTTLIDFQPYRPSTDSLLFTYPELLSILGEAQRPPLFNADAAEDRPRLPVLKVVDSAVHPDAARNTPVYASSMMPLELAEMSHGNSLEEFKEVWEDAVRSGLRDE